MAKKLQFRRLFMLTLLLGLAFAGLGYRLVDLQVLRHDELKSKAQENTQRKFRLEPRRGDILDRKGNLLATSVFVKTVCADPTIMSNYQAVVARAIAPLLQMSEGELCQRMQPRYYKNENGETVPYKCNILKRKLPADAWEKVQLAMSRLNFGVDEKKLPKSRQKLFNDLRKVAIFTERVDDQQRMYPNRELACHVLGYVGVNNDTNSATCGQTVGMDGLERALHSKLAGVPGWRVTETDRRHREVVDLREQEIEPHDGLNAVLTIDSVIQHNVEVALADAMARHTPASASCVVVRPRTGEILAMAALPDFDSNNPGGATPDARRNRMICDVQEPGSTFKIVVVSGALNERVVTLADQFDCERGHFAFAGKILHDHEPYGVLSVENIITKSSNIGAAKIGIKLGSGKLYQYMTDFGFGARTGVPLIGEVGGIVQPVAKWNKLSVSRIPMGHEVAVTPLQIVMAMCAIANGGLLMRPTLVDHLEDQKGNVVVQYQPQRVRQVISEATAKQMVEALKTVPTPEGTAPKAALEHYTVAGKTGTAQKPGPGGYQLGKYFSSFIGFFPADNPELCIAVFLDEPNQKQGYYGGQVAAPTFKQIAELTANYLNIRPEMEDATAVAKSGTDRAVKVASVATEAKD